jgi:hypothetical protein
MSAHARLAASSAHRWLVCAGSIGESGKASQYAADGTYAHAIAAKCLDDQSLSPSDFLLKKDKVDGFDVICDLEMIEAIRVYLDAVDEDMGDAHWIEMPLHKIAAKVDKDTGGTADCVRYRASTRSLRVFDFKFGSGTYVEATDNKQMKLYALLALLELSTQGLLVDEVEVTIVQPRFEGAAPVRSEKFKALELLDFAADVQEAAEKTRLPNPPVVAGEHCKFCPKARTCPELEKRQTALLTVQFPIIAGVEYDLPALATALGSIALVKERIKAIEEFAYAEATRGIEIPGYKLVDKIARRQWISEGDVIEWAQKNAIDPYEPRSILSPAKIEEKLKEAAPRGKKKEAGKVLEPFVTKVSSGTALVPIADNRPPAKRIEAQDFPALNG